MTTHYWPWAIFLSGFLMGSWVIGLFGLPGNWLMLAAIVVFALVFPASVGPGIGWPTVTAIAILVILGEAIEFIASAAGLAKGGSKRGAVMATLLSFLGGLVGAGLLGPLGILLFAALGALVGAVVGELWKGRTERDSWELGKIAFWGRLLGSAAKAILGAAVIAVATIAAWWNWQPWQ